MDKNKFIKTNVPGDGSCFFHSVSVYLFIDDHKHLQNINQSQLNRKAEKYIASHNIRKRVVDWMKQNLDRKLSNGTTLRNEILDDKNMNNNTISKQVKNKVVTDYLKNMRKYTSYAGQIEITATAYLLDRNIRVWILNKGKYQKIPLGYEIDPSKKDIHLFHNFGSGLPAGLHHFETLYPKKEFKSKPKTKKQKSKPKKQKPKTQKKQPSKTLKRQVVKEPAKRRKNKRTRRK
jgi:hypothetical protein